MEKDRGKRGTEAFIRKFMDGQRERLKREIEKLRKEIENGRKIDVRVIGRSGIYRVYGKGDDLKCDCPQFRRSGECHHVELVRSLRRVGLLEGKEMVKPPVVVWKDGIGEAEFDRDNYRIVVPRKDENPERTVKMLYEFGYGLSAMKEMGTVGRKMNMEELGGIIHGKSVNEEIGEGVEMEA